MPSFDCCTIWSIREFLLFCKISHPPFLLPSPPSKHIPSFHIPGITEDMLDVAQENVRRKNNQALVGVSMESAPKYPLLSDRAVLARFDILATWTTHFTRGTQASYERYFLTL